MKVIAFTGYKGSGKSLAADYIANNYDITPVALARPMKLAAQALFRWTDSHTDGPLKETIDPNFGISPRQFLQHIGTEYFQYIIPEAYPPFAEATGRLMWCKVLEKTYQHLPYVVIQDMRFLHEAAFFRSHSGVESCFIIRIDRPDLTPSDPHPSEVEGFSIPCDRRIINDSTIEALYHEIDLVMHSLGFRKDKSL